MNQFHQYIHDLTPNKSKLTKGRNSSAPCAIFIYFGIVLCGFFLATFSMLSWYESQYLCVHFEECLVHLNLHIYINLINYLHNKCRISYPVLTASSIYSTNCSLLYIIIASFIKQNV